MRRLVCSIPLVLLLATLSPSTATTPLVFRCSASVTTAFTPNWSGLTWDWSITSGSGVCRTDPLGETFDVTLSEAGAWGFPVGDAIHDWTFGFDVRLRLTGRSTGSTRTYRQFWEGLRLNCSTGRFTVRSATSSRVAVGTGNLKYCGQLPAPSGTHPATVTWNFIGA